MDRDTGKKRSVSELNDRKGEPSGGTGEQHK